MGNQSALPALPPIDPGNGPAAIYNLAWWIQRFILAFPNAVGQAIDPTSTGQAASGESGRDGSLDITVAPTVSYLATTLGNDLQGAIIGQVDVTFTLPDRAVGVEVDYAEQGQTNYERLYFTTSPGRVMGLKVGISYDFKVAGEAANGSLGPFSTITTVAISQNLASGPTAPTGVAATGYPLGIVVSWTAHTDPTVHLYSIQRADDAAFTTNLVTYYSRTTFFVDQFAGQGVSRYYRVAGVRDTGQLGTFSSGVNASTAGVNTSEMVAGSVSFADREDTAGPFALSGSSTEDIVETISNFTATQGVVLLFGSLTVEGNGGETFTLRLRRDDAVGDLLGGPQIITISDGSTGTDNNGSTVFGLDSSPVSPETYVLTCEASGSARDASNITLIALNLKV